MSRAATAEHPHALTPAGDQWAHSCPDCHLPIQGGATGLAAHRRTVHTRAGDPRTPINIRL
ncbi:hypothetical protein [Streptomyces aureoverticillatus]|uniref:hypothetical protein n=1 Tax=Streptomyces aureoverticillatus TaxID=66871 RepID=UPI0013DBF9F2|nr:hypothetical protein [Streptomyces aureoverticillatus]QIB49512.1 hypothetical protein G3H79_40795 [Streptomyces aureoverticillatus]